MLPEESMEALKQMKDFVDLLDGVIQDLTSAKDALNSNLSIVSDPLKFLMLDGDEAEKIIKDNGSKAQLYVYMAANKLDALATIGKEVSE